jgi:hypothetical protein
MKQLEPLDPIWALAQVLHVRNAETARLLTEFNHILRQQQTAGGSQSPIATVNAPMLHVLPERSAGGGTMRRPFQAAVHLREGVGVLAWQDMTTVLQHRPGQNPLDAGATFVPCQKCGVAVHAIVAAELPMLLIAVQKLLVGEAARNS